MTGPVRFQVLIPARLGSHRLPDKPLADLGGVPMVVRVAQRALASGAQRVVVCTDDRRVEDACAEHGVQAIRTRADHATGTDRLAEACAILALGAEEIVVNVQGDEPLIPPAIIRDVAGMLAAEPECDIATVAHPLHRMEEFLDPNVVKVVRDDRGRALLFSRAPIPWSRDAFASLFPFSSFAASAAKSSAGTEHPSGFLAEIPAALPPKLPADLPALRHVGLYAYRAGFLARFPTLPVPAIERHEKLEQLRALAHGVAIAVLQVDAALPPGVDTPADLERIRAWFG